MASKLVFQDICGKVNLPTFSKKYGHRLQRTVLSTKDTSSEEGSITVDSFLSTTSKNPVENRVVTQAIVQVPQVVRNTLRDMFGEMEFNATDVTDIDALTAIVIEILRRLKSEETTEV